MSDIHKRLRQQTEFKSYNTSENIPSFVLSLQHYYCWMAAAGPPQVTCYRGDHLCHLYLNCHQHSHSLQIYDFLNKDDRKHNV